MEMQSLQAAFNTQDEAESAIRKLSALRGDRFRLEKLGSGTDQPASTGAMEAIADPHGFTDTGGVFTDSAAASSVEASSTLGEFASPEALYSLSVHVPGSVSEQAREVIRQAGGLLAP